MHVQFEIFHQGQKNIKIVMFAVVALSIIHKCQLQIELQLCLIRLFLPLPAPLTSLPEEDMGNDSDQCVV